MKSITKMAEERNCLKVMVLLRLHILVRGYNHEYRYKDEKDDADREEEHRTIIHASDLSEPKPPWHPTLEQPEGSHPQAIQQQLTPCDLEFTTLIPPRTYMLGI